LVENKIKLLKTDKLVLLGDYIDRGEDSKKVIDYILHLMNIGFDVIPLMGNHEAMLLDAYSNEQQYSKWIQSGGIETCKSFDINSLKDLEYKYITFLQSLPHYYSFQDHLFVHAGFNDDLANPFSDHYSMLWRCKERYTHPMLADKTIVHGHHPIKLALCEDRVSSKQPVLNIDTGCVYKGIIGFGQLTAYHMNLQRTISV
jgi:serine/threonine protein phosphatase 1